MSRLAALLLPSLLLACRADKGDTGGPVDSGTMTDADGDGFGVAEDCDDADPAVYPGAPETDCTDPVDYNCDGSVGYADADGDGVPACEDCDDASADAAPGLDEVCDAVDNDCNGLVDDEALDATTWYGDADEDGFGGTAFQAVACEAPTGFVDNADDCDDLSAVSYPGADEECDERDNDCDGETDEDVLVTWYADTDGDGYGDAAAATGACERPRGHVDNSGDCDDTTATTNPASYEVCDGVDNDCDGDSDEVGALGAATWYQDGDGDGYGTTAATLSACDQPAGFASVATDCDDAESAVNPGATESCDSVDNDCDGTVDEADAIDASTWYDDVDGDGYGDAAASTVACEAPSGAVADDTDCDDADAAVNPGATEVCDDDDTDEDCSGLADDADTGVDTTTYTTWWADADGDGFGDAAGASLDQCDQPSGYADNDEDCDDTDSGYTTNCSDGTSQINAGVTCASILADHPSSADGTYWVDPDGDGDTSDAFEAYCDMSGGGWTYESQGQPFTMTYTGATQTLETPGVTTTILFTLYGAAAGRGYNTFGSSCGSGSNTGGYGGMVEGSASFTANTTLYVEVGGQGDDGGCADQGSYNTRSGGYNGGGRGTQGGSAGGGATDVRTIDGDLTSRIIVAGGGGGCGSESCIYGGGHGGGLTGSSPSSYSNVTGGTQSAGGTSSYSGSATGSLGEGGDNVQGNDEGGGGGGYYGGASGGRANTPGAGGSSYYGGMSGNLSTSAGANSGDGYVEYIFQ